MFLVKDERHGAVNLVFTSLDPRLSGYNDAPLPVESLDYDLEAVHAWPNGEARPMTSVGRNPANPGHYKVFRSSDALRQAGFEHVPGTPGVFSTWDDYARMQQIPPNPDFTDEIRWFDYLDRLDAEARRRRASYQPSVPASTRRDDVAAWVAKEHMIVDSSVREVWHLPDGAPADEIRLVEVSDRFPVDDDEMQATSSGLAIDGAKFRLSIVDASTDAARQAAIEPTRLPSGWSLADKKSWRRGE